MAQPDYRFNGQRAQETVLLLTRQHPFVLLKPMLLAAAVFLLPLLIYVFLNAGTALAVTVLATLLVGGFIALRAWHEWSGTLLLLTNERVLHYHQQSLFQREMAECGLGSIQQISHAVRGPLRTVAGYGDITIVTAGAQTVFNLRNIPDPYGVQQEIQRAASGEGYAEEGEAGGD